RQLEQLLANFARRADWLKVRSRCGRRADWRNLNDETQNAAASGVFRLSNLFRPYHLFLIIWVIQRQKPALRTICRPNSGVATYGIVMKPSGPYVELISAPYCRCWRRA